MRIIHRLAITFAAAAEDFPITFQPSPRPSWVFYVDADEAINTAWEAEIGPEDPCWRTTFCDLCLTALKQVPNACDHGGIHDLPRQPCDEMTLLRLLSKFSHY